MNKAQLIDQLATRFGGNKKAAGHALESVLDTITRSVVIGERVAITGFGVFEKSERQARLARNPATGETVKVKKTVVPRFRPGAAFKSFVSGATRLPKAVVEQSPVVAAASTTRTATASVAKRSTGSRAAKTTAAATKTAAKKATTKTASAKKTSAKKAATKKATTKKATTKKATTKKAATKKATGKKATAKRTTAKKAPAKRTTAKTTARRTTARKS